MPTRAAVLCWLILMPLSLNTRAFARPTPKEEIMRLAETRAVHELFRSLQQREPELRRFQTDLVKVPAPPFRETQRAEWLAAKFRELGLEVEIDSAGNLVALRKGTDPKAKLLALTAHIDTVFPEGTPAELRTDGSKLYGPGISDNAAGVTALYALAAALAEGTLLHRAGVLFVGNVGEEGEGDLRGMRYLFNESKYKDRIGTTIVIDGAGNDAIVTQALGSRRFEVIVRGQGGHSWSDFGTPNPIVALAKAVARFSDTNVADDPKTSFNVGVIQGGTSVNTIPDSASIRVDIRSAAAREIDRLEKALRDAVASAVRESSGVAEGSSRKGTALTHEVKLIGSRPAADLKQDARVLQTLQAVDLFLGIKSNVRRASTDANIPLSLGKEAVSIGAGGAGGGVHTIREWYDATGREIGLKRIALLVMALTGAEDVSRKSR